MNAPVVSLGLFFQFPTYLWRWVIFGAIGGLAIPVATSDGDYGLVKVWQIGFGVFFGLVCAVVFTSLQNTFNKSRSRGVSWAILIGTWLGVKFAFYGVAALGI
ncbi:hypothetical protein [Lysobacter sp. P5_B9]